MNIQDRILGALSRITERRSPMSIPPHPSDVDVVLVDCGKMIAEQAAEIEKLKAENERLKAAQWEFADLVESTLPVIDRGGWSEISAELKTAITKARGN